MSENELQNLSDVLTWPFFSIVQLCSVIMIYHLIIPEFIFVATPYLWRDFSVCFRDYFDHWKEKRPILAIGHQLCLLFRLKGWIKNGLPSTSFHRYLRWKGESKDLPEKQQKCCRWFRVVMNFVPIDTTKPTFWTYILVSGKVKWILAVHGVAIMKKLLCTGFGAIGTMSVCWDTKAGAWGFGSGLWGWITSFFLYSRTDEERSLRATEKVPMPGSKVFGNTLLVCFRSGVEVEDF